MDHQTTLECGATVQAVGGCTEIVVAAPVFLAEAPTTTAWKATATLAMGFGVRALPASMGDPSIPMEMAFGARLTMVPMLLAYMAPAPQAMVCTGSAIRTPEQGLEGPDTSA